MLDSLLKVLKCVFVKRQHHSQHRFAISDQIQFVCRFVARSSCGNSFKDGIFGSEAIHRLCAADRFIEDCVEGLVGRPGGKRPRPNDTQSYSHQCFVHCLLTARLLQTGSAVFILSSSLS